MTYYKLQWRIQTQFLQMKLRDQATYVDKKWELDLHENCADNLKRPKIVSNIEIIEN